MRCSSATSAIASAAGKPSQRPGLTSSSSRPRGSKKSSGLKKLGYDVAKIDGKAGMNTRSLIGVYQKANNLKVDCWPTEAVVKHLRANPQLRASAAGAPGETGATAPR